MTVKDKTEEFLKKNSDYFIAGNFKIDGSEHCILQHKNSNTLVDIYESHDFFEDPDKIQEMTYKNLKVFFDEHPPYRI